MPPLSPCTGDPNRIHTTETCHRPLPRVRVPLGLGRSAGCLRRRYSHRQLRVGISTIGPTTRSPTPRLTIQIVGVASAAFASSSTTPSSGVGFLMAVIGAGARVTAGSWATPEWVQVSQQAFLGHKRRMTSKLIHQKSRLRSPREGSSVTGCPPGARTSNDFEVDPPKSRERSPREGLSVTGGPPGAQTSNYFEVDPPQSRVRSPREGKCPQEVPLGHKRRTTSKLTHQKIV